MNALAYPINPKSVPMGSFPATKKTTLRDDHSTRPSYLFLRHSPTIIPIVLDIEASGFGAGSYPIEVGAVLRSGRSVSYLIRPEPEWLHWSLEGEATHGIRREQLEREGLPVRYVAQALNELLKGEVVYTDGWGVDSSWLSLLYEHAGMSRAFRLESLNQIMKEKQFDIWEETKQQVIQESNLRRHRAGTDAVILQKTFLRSFW
jgi:hypothetical protein